MNGQGKAGADYGANVKKKNGLSSGARVSGYYEVRCFGPDGQMKWEDEIHNLVVNAGLDHLLDATLSGGSQITTWYVGLTDGTPTAAAGDTMSSHAGWTEVTAYDESNRQTWSDGGVSSQSVTNSASVASFTCSTNSTTVGGAFLTSDNTKSGTSGTLYSIGAFSGGDKSLDDGDTLEVTATFTMADDGA
jgi:hypothetical protein